MDPENKDFRTNTGHSCQIRVGEKTVVDYSELELPTLQSTLQLSKLDDLKTKDKGEKIGAY